MGEYKINGILHTLRKGGLVVARQLNSQKLHQISKGDLDNYRQSLKVVVDNLRNRAKNIQVATKVDVNKAFEGNRSKKGLYIWYGVCNPFQFVSIWQKRIELYKEYDCLNRQSVTPIKSKKGNIITFRLPKANPYWNRKKQYEKENNLEIEVPIYVGMAQGESETLRGRLGQHCEASIQTSALKLFRTSKPKQCNKLISKFLRKDTLLIQQLGLKNIRCEAIIIEQSQTDRFLTYERIIREVLNPLIGEK